MYLRQPLFAVLILALTSAEPGVSQTAGSPAEPWADALVLLSFNKSGKPEDKQALADLKARCKNRPPTDVILLAHGWNNSKGSAEEMYKKMVSLIAAQAKKRPVKGKEREFSPLVVGIQWPSQGWSDDDPRSKIAAKEAEDLLRSWLPPRAGTPEGLLKLLVSKNNQEAGIRALKVAIAVHNFLEDDDLDAAILKEFDLLKSENLLEAIRVLSFYEMKRRAGVVGAAGVRETVAELNAAVPNARFHMVGHSFGCKLWLSCLAKSDSAVADSLTLLQGAISMHCFAEKIPFIANEKPGAYRAALVHVKGTVAVTYTDSDYPLRFAFPIAVKAGGYVGEHAARKHDLKHEAYWALGAKGHGGDPKRAISLKPGTPLSLPKELVAINANGVIMGHNGIYNERVADLILAVIAARRIPPASRIAWRLVA